MSDYNLFGVIPISVSEEVKDFGVKLDNVWEKNFSIQGEKVLRSLPVYVGNTINAVDPTGGKVMDYVSSGFDPNELSDDNEAGDVWDDHVTEQYTKIEELTQRARKLDTGKGIVKGIREGDWSDVALGVSNAIVSTVTTVVPAIMTRGKSIPIQIMTPMYTEYNAEKAKALYPDDDFEIAITKLHESGQDEWHIPTTLGVLSTYAERIGFKGMTNAILNRARTKGTAKAAQFLMAGSAEGTTEWIQGGIQSVSTSLAKQEKDPYVVAQNMWDHMTSDEGLEEFLQGFIGGSTVSSVGNKINRAFRNDNDNLVINNYVNQLGQLNQNRIKANDPEIKNLYTEKIKKVEDSFRKHLLLDRKKSTYLTEDQSYELLDILDSKQNLNSRLVRLDRQRRRGIVTEQDYAMSKQDIETQIQNSNKRISDIKIEANKKLLHDDLRITEDPISKVVGMDRNILKTPGDFLEAVNAKLRGMGSQKQYTIDELRYVDGLVVGDTTYINEEVAAESNAISVGSHELLHGVLKSSLRDSQGKLTKEGSQLIQDFLGTLTTRERNIVQGRIDSNYRFDEAGNELEFDEYAEEYLNAYADASIKNQLTPGILPKIKKFLEKTFNSGDKGFKNLSFESGKQVKEFLDAYVSDRKKGKFRDQFVKMAQEGVGKSGDRVVMSKTKRDKTPKERKEAINEIGKEFYDEDLKETVQFEQLGGNAYYEMYSGKAKGFEDKITKEIREQGLLDGVILEKYKNYKKNLDKANVTEKEFLNTVYAELVPHIRNYKPEMQLQVDPKKRTGLNGWIMPQIGNKSLQAFNILTKGETQAPTVPVGQTTKEGDIKVQVEADVDQAMIDLEMMDMSPQAVAKREAQKNKKKEVRKSKLRQDYGVEDGGDIYNSVLNSARQSLILAYQKTRDIKNKNDRAAAIVKMIADEYAGEKGLTSGRYTELFKQVKNSLGTKEYINNLKKNRESIVESIFTSDFVQIERNVPDSEKIFTKFVKKLTSKQEVQDAVDKGLLPKDSLKAIDKGQAVNLYEKVMPTENQFVGFFDQPLTVEKTDKTGKIYYVRSGLKGTRKDGLSKHISKAFIFDALMEVRQEPEVSELLTNEFNAELDIVDLASKIGREVDVQFSKNNAVTDINNAIDNGTNTDVYNQIRFSKSHRDQYERRLEKNRPDLSEEQRKNAVQSIFDFVDKNDIPNNKKAKLEKLALHYMANGYLILPEDGYKVIEAERVATIKKLDAFSYKNPNVLLEENVVKEKVKRTNPDDLDTFTNKTEYSDGVVVYDVEDSKDGQLAVRKVIDTHFGKKANPWCLCARQAPGAYIETDESYSLQGAEQIAKTHQDLGRRTNIETYINPDGTKVWEIYVYEKGQTATELDNAFLQWKNYNQDGEGLGFKIAFHNGELIAFRDGKESPRWWDRMDKPSDAPMIKGKKGKDGYKTVSLAYRNKTIPQYLEKVTGDNKNGVTIKKDLDGTVTDITSKKDGTKHGKQFQRRDDRSAYYIQEMQEVYDKGNRTSFKEVRIYKDYKGESGKEPFTNGKDELMLNNITKYEKSYTHPVLGPTPDSPNIKDYTETIIVEGTIDQKYFKEFNDPSSAEGFVKTNLKYMTPAYERYYSRQGEKVNLVVKKGETKSFTINNEVQETRLRNNEAQFSKSKLQLTELQYVNKPTGAIQGKIQSIQERIGTNNEQDGDLLAISLLEDMQNGFINELPTEQLYDILVSKLPQTPESYSADFSSLDNFIKFIKKTTMPQIRSVGFQASKTWLKKITDGVNDTEKVRIVNEYLKNIGRSTRSGMIDGITTNRMLLENILKPLLGKEFIDTNYQLEKVEDGEIIVYKEGKNFVPVPMYENIENIKNNTRRDPALVKRVSDQAKDAKTYVMSIINDKTLNNSEKLAILDLMSLDQRGAIRKMYTMGITLTEKSKLTSKDLVLEHEVTVKDMVNKLKERVKKGEKYQPTLDEYIEFAQVHVLPKKIDTFLNKEGLKFKGDVVRYIYSPDIIMFFTEQYANGFIESLPKSIENINKNQAIDKVTMLSRSSSKPTKGISILDFDDTLATSSSLIRFTKPDGTKGTLTPEQYASTYQDLLGLGYKFDFSEFTKVIDGKPAPLLNKAKKLAKKFGTKNMFILTARPAESAPAIRKFLKENGLNIPLKNITGLGNSTADAKALWVLDKATEGYNDFYFADDAIQNVEAVQNMLNQIDVKSKVQQARTQFSKSKINNTFNEILEDISDINRDYIFSRSEAIKDGSKKGKFRWFIPPSHEDFVGLLYNFIGEGELGNRHRAFFEKTLIKPLNEGYRRLNAHKQHIANNYKKLIKDMPDIYENLSIRLPNSSFTVEDAIRVYLWNKAGYEIPGLSEEQEIELVNLVENSPQTQKFADMLGRISLIDAGYTTPGDYWSDGGIKFDLIDATGRVGRSWFFKEFIENSEKIFGKLDGQGKLQGDNINKIEAIYGKNFREALEDMLYRTINGTNRKSGGNRIVNGWLDWVNGSVGAIMFFNMRSAILQQLSFVNFMNFADNNIFKASARFADQSQFWNDFARLFNSDYLKQRRAGAGFDVNANEIAREVSGARHPVRVAIRKLLDLGFTPTQIGDSFAIAIGGASFFRNRTNTYRKQGLTKEQAEEKAFLDFQEIAEETQQSARPDMISQQQASPLGRFILAFQNVTSQYTRIVKKSYLDLIKRRISKGYTDQAQSDTANISRIIYYGAIQSMIFYGLQQALFAMLFSDDEEDEKFFKTKKDRVIHGTIDSLLRGTGVYGAVISTLKNTVIKFTENSKSDSWFNTDAWTELLQVSPPIGIKVRKWRATERTLVWNRDVIKHMSLFDIDNPLYDAISTGVEGFFNVPLNRLYKKVQNIRAGLDSENEWWQRIAVTLGWSKWDVGIDDKIDKKKYKKLENKSQEEEHKKLQEKEREDGKKVLCAAVSRKGTRCKNEVLSGGSYCTIHVEVEKNKTGEKRQCKKIKSNRERCKMQTDSKSGYCFYHD
jgi:hypothetical protein